MDAAFYDGSDQGWGDYPDERIGLGPIGGFEFEGMGGLAYTPDLAPVGSKSTYWPRSVSADTDALQFLGFLRGPVLQSYGSQSADMDNAAGAWDPNFREAVTAFQQVAGPFGYTGVVDGWIGPKTRAALANAVAAKNASESPVTPPFVPPVTPPAPNVPPYTPPSPPYVPPALPPPPGVTPASTAKKSNTTMYLGLAAAGVVVAGVAAWALLD